MKVKAHWVCLRHEIWTNKISKYFCTEIKKKGENYLYMLVNCNLLCEMVFFCQFYEKGILDLKVFRSIFIHFKAFAKNAYFLKISYVSAFINLFDSNIFENSMIAKNIKKAYLATVFAELW